MKLFTSLVLFTLGLLMICKIYKNASIPDTVEAPKDYEVW